MTKALRARLDFIFLRNIGVPFPTELPDAAVVDVDHLVTVVMRRWHGKYSFRTIF